MQNLNNQITVVGSINCDLTAYVKDFPKPHQTISATSSTIQLGGKGLNQAAAALKMGVPVSMLGCIGNDAFAVMAKEYLQKIGLDMQYIKSVDDITGVANIFVNQRGDNMIAVNSGANAHLATADIDRASNAFSDSELLLVQLETPLNTVIHALKKARSEHKITLLNPAPADKAILSELSLVDIITPNETEAELLTGIYPDNQANAKRAADALHELGVKSVVITMGEKGYFVSSEGKSAFKTPIKVDVVDPTGAGDVFNGVLAAFLANGHNLFKAASYAAIAASLSVSRASAQGAAPSLEEVLQLQN